MTEAAKRFFFGRKGTKERTQENEARGQLMESIAKTRVLIHQAYTSFNTTGDPDLIESYVFEINSLESRYSYLLRRVKELDGIGMPDTDTQLTDALEKV